MNTNMNMNMNMNGFTFLYDVVKEINFLMNE